MIGAATSSSRSAQPAGGSNFFVAFRVLPPERRGVYADLSKATTNFIELSS